MPAKPLRMMRKVMFQHRAPAGIGASFATMHGEFATAPIDKGDARPTLRPDDTRSAVTKQSETL